MTNVVDGNGVVVTYNDDGTEWRHWTYNDGKFVVDYPTLPPRRHEAVAEHPPLTQAAASIVWRHEEVRSATVYHM